MSWMCVEAKGAKAFELATTTVNSWFWQDIFGYHQIPTKIFALSGEECHAYELKNVGRYNRVE